ncbi:MAG: serine hydroxymethyltransferase, partial [Patescibacteria group bacterium]
KTTEEGLIDYEEIESMAREHKPKLILVGYSAYSREIDYGRIKSIADEVGAFTMADIAHIAGLIAAGEMNNPVPLFDVVTTTTHKTLRGPRGGMILCKSVHTKAVDKAVFPGLQGGPHENVIAAKAVSFLEALQPEFKTYAKQIRVNAKVLEQELRSKGYRLLFGGTDNHLLLIDVSSKGVTGGEAEKVLDCVGITVNKNMIPNDTRPPLDPSGIRLGTPALTTRGMKEDEMKLIAQFIDDAIIHRKDETSLSNTKLQVCELARRFPLYPNLTYR